MQVLDAEALFLPDHRDFVGSSASIASTALRHHCGDLLRRVDRFEIRRIVSFVIVSSAMTILTIVS
jgi:hypothetical protein